MRLSIIVILISLLSLLVTQLTWAVESDKLWSISEKISTTSNYVDRGLSQTWGGPALQAEFEAEHDSGFYVGISGSNVSRNLYPGGELELTSWLGFEYEMKKNTTLAIEGLYYAYPRANLNKCDSLGSCDGQSFNTFEGRIIATKDYFSASYAYAFTDYFGASPASGYTTGTHGTWYVDLSANPKLPIDVGWQLKLHTGYTHYSAQYESQNPLIIYNPNYWDWKVGVMKSLKDSQGMWQFELDYTQASNQTFYNNTNSFVNSSTFNLGHPTVALSISRFFNKFD